MVYRIGIDVGGVIIDAIANDGTDTDLRGENFMQAKPVEGAYASIRQLVNHYGTTNVFIISKCGETREDRTRRWLQGNDFYTTTGFSEANLYFCRDRAGKAPISTQLGITHYIDDHTEVLRYMKNVPFRYLFGPQKDAVQPSDRDFIVVDDWNQALVHIFST